MLPSAWEFCYDSLGGQFTAPWGLCPVGKTEPQSLQTQSSGCPGQVSTGHQAQPPTHRGFLEEVRDEAEPRRRLPQSSFHLVSVFTSLLPHPILNLPLPRLGLCRSFHCRVIPLCPPLTPYPTSWHHLSEASGGWDLGEASPSVSRTLLSSYAQLCGCDFYFPLSAAGSSLRVSFHPWSTVCPCARHT